MDIINFMAVWEVISSICIVDKKVVCCHHYASINKGRFTCQCTNRIHLLCDHDPCSGHGPSHICNNGIGNKIPEEDVTLEADVGRD